MTDDPFGPADLLTIPPFLRRSLRGTRAASKVAAERTLDTVVEHLPAALEELRVGYLGGKWKQYRVHLTYPMRGIPTGNRVLNVLIGRKWVRLMKPDHVKGTRITKKIWDTLKKEEIT